MALTIWVMKIPRDGNLIGQTLLYHDIHKETTFFLLPFILVSACVHYFSCPSQLHRALLHIPVDLVGRMLSGPLEGKVLFS